MLKLVAIILISGLIGLIGQLLYKKSLNEIAPTTYTNFLKAALSSAKIWCGFCLIAISIIIWLAALSLGDLNLTYSLNSMQYLLTLVAARLFLGENIDRNKLIGTLLIALGIILAAFS